MMMTSNEEYDAEQRCVWRVCVCVCVCVYVCVCVVWCNVYGTYGCVWYMCVCRQYGYGGVYKGVIYMCIHTKVVHVSKYTYTHIRNR